MKIVAVQCGDPPNLVAYCGGIDVWPDRVTTPCHAEVVQNRVEPVGLHDTMLEIVGEAASELNLVLHNRWVDVIATNTQPETPLKADLVYEQYVGKNDEGSVLAQVALTVDDYVDPPYVFARDGDLTLSQTLIGAIGKARQYIYIEDQYFRCPEVIDALANAALRGVVVLVVIPDILWEAKWDDCKTWLTQLTRVAEIPDATWPWQTPGSPKELTAPYISPTFSVYGLWNDQHTAPIYVHSKLMIVDDILLSCGSANLDNKGMGSYDSRVATSCECNVFSIDAAVNGQGSRKIARDTRIRLWAEHLFGRSALADAPLSREWWYAELLDPIRAIRRYWMNPPSSSRIRRLS